MRVGEKRRFRRDPLKYIDILRRRSGTDVFRLPHGGYCVRDADPAQTLLTESLTALTRDARLTVTGGDTRAVISEGNVPRPFVLHRTPRHGGTEHDREGR
ncbi:hypothetical protein [Streptomyces eurythermus]|uniref:hypothetical protein n=1 Tax=Streptomyces eurythermus TaxID=42237 RepID=UPI0036F52864